ETDTGRTDAEQHVRRPDLRDRHLAQLERRAELRQDHRAHGRGRHGVVSHFALTASRSTAPSAVRGSASVNATTLGRLNRAIVPPTKSITCCAVYAFAAFTSTTALIASPQRVSGMPYTQTPVTPSIWTITDSTSAG